MSDQNDNFFDGLDDAETVPTPEVTDTPTPEPDKAEVPADKAPEAAKPADKAPEKPAEPTPDKLPEKAAAPEVKAPEAPDPRKWVPVGAHVELRNELKALKDEISALKNPPKPAPPKPETPDFTADPKAYVDHKVQAALEQLETGLKPVAEKADKADASAAEARFFNALTTAEQQFAAAQPDYFGALQHLRTLRANELSTLHPEATREQVEAAIQQEELQLAAGILRSGRNPSQVAYQLAKARGYTPPQPKAPEPEKKPEAPAAKLLPDVPEPKKLPPDLTLGTGTGSPVTEEGNDDPFEAAWTEVFGQRKRA